VSGVFGGARGLSSSLLSGWALSGLSGMGGDEVSGFGGISAVVDTAQQDMVVGPEGRQADSLCCGEAV
jgi:hypothetical protein